MSSPAKKIRPSAQPKSAKKLIKGNKILDGFLKAFYQQVPAEDVVGWNAAELANIAHSMCDWAMDRKKTEQKVRVVTPEISSHGASIPHTVIQIINDDMAFLVDSVAAELIFQGLTIETLFHPILHVERSAAGKLQTIYMSKEKPKDSIAESCIYIQIEQLLTPAAAQKLVETLRITLEDVRHATSDWRPMLKKVDDVAKEVASFSKNVEKNELQEAQDFLHFLRANNFTFLGYRAFKISDAHGKTQSKPVPQSALGVLKADKNICFGQGVDSSEIAALKHSKSPIIVSKLMDEYATVHRRVPMDAVSIKIFDAKGALTGVHVFVGLFTSSTYSCRTGEVPLVRRKVLDTIERSGFLSGTHDRNALEHILEKMPRDELFQVTGTELYTMSLGILRLQEKHRIALFAHTDAMNQYMSCLVYVPREKYNTHFRMAVGQVLEQAIHGKLMNYYTTLDDSPLARVLFTVKLDAKIKTKFDHAATEHKLIELGREWHEKLKHVLNAAFGKAKGAELTALYGDAFTSAYHDSINIKNTMHDILHLEELLHSDEKICVDFYQLTGTSEKRLKVYHKNAPVPLSDILPVLENMGLKCLSEMPYEVTPKNANKTIWIHDFTLQGAEEIKIETVKENFENTFLQVWYGNAENDGLNRLALLANLTWQEVRVLRTYNCFMRQARFPFSKLYIEQVLSLYPQIAQALVHLFKELNDPAYNTAHGVRGKALGAKIETLLQAVQKLDHDRILRSFKTLIDNTLRTSFFQTDANGQPKSCLALKLDSKKILDLPLPRPHVEIFVYSSRVEAVHLRGGEIARGGIRWSDRHDDFRTEVLGLMKSQMVKNAVIVPVGAKGGFIVKQPPKTGGRDAYQQEGIECYKIFVQALLDLTDNNVKGKIIRPVNVVCHDAVDPYLVVAADKGTATFSNIANALSLKAGFWLQDAFASGGSSGYDHKEMAITARGGWESVKRHFRELGRDVQKEPFTVVGVGDMGGDVFGNAMLLSRKIQLQAACNHVHIFCDPTPDTEKSFSERERLFKARGGWDAYDKAKLSAGGMVYERSAKTLKLTPQIKKCFSIAQNEVTPDELIKIILKADVELLWFGGIGTFLKSSKQSHADADDKSNDAVRIDAVEVRAKVIGEGANMGVTQLARIEYAHKGGKINTDFIDNSGGVDCSDHEVNIKILLTDVMAKGKMTLPQRDKLLAQMTDDVAALVLKDNYQQTQSLSLQLSRAQEHLPQHIDFIRTLEKADLINRRLEGLPDDEALERLVRDGGGLTRPELSILMAYAKMTLFNQVMETSLPSNTGLEWMLTDYFPKPLHKFAGEIKAHKLKHQIVATQIVNFIVNRMGPMFVQSRIDKTGSSAGEVMKAFMIVVDVFGVNAIWKAIEDLDNKISGQVQLTALYEVSLVVKRVVTWFLRFGGDNLKIEEAIALFKPSVEQLKKDILTIVPHDLKQTLLSTENQLTALGMPKKIADEISVMTLLSSACDIVNITRRIKGNVKTVAAVYFQIGERLSMDWLRLKASQVISQNPWQSRVMSGLMDDFYIQQAALALIVLQSGGKTASAPVTKWFDAHNDITGKIEQMIAELKSLPRIEIEMLMLISQRIGQLVHQAQK
jgi:glutamate dehydrogenase